MQCFLCENGFSCSNGPLNQMCAKHNDIASIRKIPCVCDIYINITRKIRGDNRYDTNHHITNLENNNTNQEESNNSGGRRRQYATKTKNNNKQRKKYTDRNELLTKVNVELENVLCACVPFAMCIESKRCYIHCAGQPLTIDSYSLLFFFFDFHLCFLQYFSFVFFFFFCSVSFFIMPVIGCCNDHELSMQSIVR